MLWLYILLQFLFYGVIAYVFYRFVYKAALANRKAALTEKPEDDDYVPKSLTWLHQPGWWHRGHQIAHKT